MVSAREVRDLLEERPDLEPAAEAVLEPDAPWTFADVDVDSGRFGELVSRGVVERADGRDDAYRVADRAAVQRALADDVPEEGSTREFGVDLDVSLPAVDRLEVGCLVGALAVVALVRSVSYPAVFQDGAVVLSGNDPYFYRYWVERLLADPKTTLSTLPGGVTKGEPLLVTTLWLASLALGGTREAAGLVLAWYPVVAAVASALLVYWLAVVVTEDRRIGLAAVLLLAVVPGHALRTSLGFADHHAFDYPWLALTALCVAVVAREATDDRVPTRGLVPASPATALAALGIALGVTGQTLAWDASPLMLVPLGLTLAVDAVVAVHRDRSPLSTGGPVVAGLALGAAATWGIHAALDWHTTLVAVAPALVLVGGVGVVAAGELARRVGVPAPAFAAVEAAGLAAGAVALATLRPDFWARLTASVTERLLAERAIVETLGLFGRSAGWLLLFGFVLLLALPYLAWATKRAVDDAPWLAPATYAWYFLVLSAIQIRFAGQLGLFTAVFAGLGFVHLAERVDVARRPAPLADGARESFAVPERRELGALALLFLLVASLGVVQVPVKVSQVTIPAEQYETAAWMADYSDRRGWEYPENYVFSDWGRNRVYNYFVSGESRSYGYAHANYGRFVTSHRPGEWYQRLSDRAGFVVTTERAVTNGSTLGARLHEAYGSRTANAPGLAHYRAVYASPGGTYKVFTLVPGAVIAGNATPNATVTLSTSVEIPGATFTYERRVTAGPDGAYTVRVPYPGEYAVGNATVTVPESAVRNGTTVRASGGGG